MDSLSKIIDYAEKHNLPTAAVVFSFVVLAVAWFGRKGAGKALSLVGGMLSAADNMLESMQRRLDAAHQELERSRKLLQALYERIDLLEKEQSRLQKKIKELASKDVK